MVGGRRGLTGQAGIGGWLVGGHGRQGREARISSSSGQSNRSGGLPKVVGCIGGLEDHLDAWSHVTPRVGTEEVVFGGKKELGHMATSGGGVYRCVCVCVDILAFSLKKTTDRTLSVSEKGGGIGG